MTPTPSPVPNRHLGPLQLIEFTRFFAAEVADGRYPFIEFDRERRWHQRIYRDPRMDIWLLSWLPSQATELHDHGGSCGAFTVLTGTLSEAVLMRGTEVVEHDRPPGGSIGFGPSYIHDVRNLSGNPAVSVHAYSPPLTSMKFYELDSGALRTIASVPTDDPEPSLAAGRV